MSRRNVVAFWLPSGTGFDHINLGRSSEHSCATSSALPKLGFHGFSNRLGFAAGLKRFSKYKPTSWISSKWARELQITFVPVFSPIHNFNSQSYYYKLNVCPSPAVLISEHRNLTAVRCYSVYCQDHRQHHSGSRRCHTKSRKKCHHPPHICCGMFCREKGVMRLAGDAPFRSYVVRFRAGIRNWVLWSYPTHYSFMKS